jgi:hypothetical protein
MKMDGSEPATSLEDRLQTAEQLCDLLRRRVDALEREREALRGRLEGILMLLDGLVVA